jgi:hypothetical protein
VSGQDRIDGLFALPPEEFVAARDALARELRTEGDPGGAAEVKALRRPTLSAWAINQVARRHPGDVEELLSAGRELREAQRRAMTQKGRTGVQELGARRRAVVDRLTQRAGDLLEGAGRGSGAHLDEIASTFLAASVEPAVAELVQAGRLDRERTPSTDLANLFGLPADAAEPAEPAEAAEDGREAREGRGARKGDAAALRAGIEAAERDARAAGREADRAARRAEAARDAARAAQEEADRKDRAAREAEKEATSARKRAEAAERELQRLRSRRR